MHMQTREDGAEQAVPLLNGHLEENRIHSRSAWLLLKVLVCTLSFLMLIWSLVSCVVYHPHDGEHKVLNSQIKELRSMDQCGRFHELATARQPQNAGVVVESGNANMFSSQLHGSMPHSAVLNRIYKESRKKVHVRSRAKMSSFLRIVEDLLHEDLLKLHQKTLCLDSHADKEVVALRARGFKDAQGINLLPALLNFKHTPENFQIKKLADQKFDFFFTSMFDRTPYPALFVAEIERILKAGGFAAMHVSLNKWRNKYITGEPGRGIKPVTLLFQHSEIVYVSSADAPGLDTIIVFKKNLQSEAVPINQKEMEKKQFYYNPSSSQSVKKPAKFSPNHKCWKYVEQRQLKSRGYAAKVQGTAGNLLYTSMLGTFLPSATRDSGKIAMKKSILMALPGASNLSKFFIQGLSNVAQLKRGIVQDSLSASKVHGKAFIEQGSAEDNMAVDS